MLPYAPKVNLLLSLTVNWKSKNSKSIAKHVILITQSKFSAIKIYTCAAYQIDFESSVVVAEGVFCFTIITYNSFSAAIN